MKAIADEGSFTSAALALGYSQPAISQMVRRLEQRTGTVLVERIFSYEGIGNMAIDAMINRDLPLIQGLVITFAVIFISINLFVDLLVTWLDPRL